MQDKTEGYLFLQLLQDLTTFFGIVPHLRPSGARHLWNYFHLWSSVQTLGRGSSVGFPQIFSALPFL